MSGFHSLLAPSDAPRWARCAGALKMGTNKKTSEDAASGTLTHRIGEIYLRLAIYGNAGADVEDAKCYTPGMEQEIEGFKFTIDEDRCERAQAYANNVMREPAALRFVEHRLNTSPILGIPNQEGHSDVVALDPLGIVMIDNQELQGVVSVHDLKDGAGHTVYAKNNLQGLIYGAAALYEFDMLAPFNAVRFCIHQPRLHHYDEWAYSRVEIEHFISIIRPPAKLAYDLYYGNTDFDPAIHLNPGEEQCMWCPARGSCPARAKRIVDMFAALLVKHEIDDETLSRLYIQLDEVESACRDFRGEALHRALQGRKITGQKIVRGKRGKRYWKDPKAAESALLFLLDEAKVYEPREIVSPTTADKQLKKLYAAVKSLVDQPPGGLSLAPESDPREEITPVQFDVLPEEQVS